MNPEPANNELDLTATIAAPGLLRPPCLLMASAAQLGVSGATPSHALPVKVLPILWYEAA